MAQLSEPIKKRNPNAQGRNARLVESIYTRCLITRSISIPMVNVGGNLDKVLEDYISFTYEGKCIVEGFIKPRSSKIVTYSSGLVQGSNIVFEVAFECEACFPVEGTIIYCIAKNITKAGIRAESSTDTPSPFVVFIARDHHYNASAFASIKEGDKFVAKVIGQRFELNDKQISIIAELKDTKYTEPRFSNKPLIKNPIEC
jgi:DNA-directed RNA polymerase subunit E'/Rpb7